MLILHVSYKTKPGQAKPFLAAIRRYGIGEATRRESGNLCYDYFMPAEDAEDCDEVLLLERWADETALLEHQQSAHIATLKTFKDRYIQSTAIQRYTVIAES